VRLEPSRGPDCKAQVQCQQACPKHSPEAPGWMPTERQSPRHQDRRQSQYDAQYPCCHHDIGTEAMQAGEDRYPEEIRIAFYDLSGIKDGTEPGRPVLCIPKGDVRVIGNIAIVQSLRGERDSTRHQQNRNQKPRDISALFLHSLARSQAPSKLARDCLDACWALPTHCWTLPSDMRAPRERSGWQHPAPEIARLRSPTIPPALETKNYCRGVTTTSSHEALPIL
jgi:hypothetical protein